MPDIGAYVTALLGRPWERDGLHCWTLTRTAVRDLFGVEVPAVLEAPEGRRTKAALFNGHPARSGWQAVQSPATWAVALMHRRGAPPDLIEHAGVYLPIDGGGVLHTADPHGVVFDSLFELPRLRVWAHPIFLVPRE